MDSLKRIPVNGRRSMYSGIGSRPSIIAEQEKPTNSTTLHPSLNAGAPLLSSNEVDAKCQNILLEIEKCKNCKNKYIESSVLHNVPQTFLTKKFQNELETELDRLLMEQILQEERRGPSSRTVLTKSTVNVSSAAMDAKTARCDGCLACNSCPCNWTPFCDADALSHRKKDLYRELMSVQKQTDTATTVQSTVAKSVLNGGDNQFTPSELLHELSTELKQIDSKLKICLVDVELHATYASKCELVTIRSIHGFDSSVKRDDAILALEHEHNRHIATIAATENIDSILEWMLEGWYFGERDTKVIKSKLNTKQPLEMPSFCQRGSLMEKASDVQINSNANAILDHAAKSNDQTQESLKAIETNIRYGLFCMTFMYFRALNLVRQEKATWHGHHDLVSLSRGPPLNAERKQMIQEEKNAQFRKARIEYAMQKARIGEDRKRQRKERECLEKAKYRWWDSRKKQADQRLAITVQRVFRGHIGRKIAKMCAFRQERNESINALMNGCAVAISRAWRGYCGRMDAKYLKKEMAEFLFAIREEEARDEEEEYLATTNPLQRWKRDI